MRSVFAIFVLRVFLSCCEATQKAQDNICDNDDENDKYQSCAATDNDKTTTQNSEKVDKDESESFLTERLNELQRLEDEYIESYFHPGYYEDELDEEEEEEELYDDNDEEKEEQENDHDKNLFEYNATITPFDDYVVAGINLAQYDREPQFELFHDFDISEYIHGHENWWELLSYRNKLERPSLSFYVDKVARKRWLPTKGYRQPKLYALLYASELKSFDFWDKVDEVKAMLPVNRSYAAKPTHKSLNNGNWLVDHNGDDETTRFSTKAVELTNELGAFNSTKCAISLTLGLYEKCLDLESWALKNVRPGMVIEERWASHFNSQQPPHEFNMFTIWGRVWVGQWNFIMEQSRHWYAFFHRNGTVALSSVSYREPEIVDWVPWDELVRLAEELGANKDMFRTDIFVGRPYHAATHGTTDPDEPLDPASSLQIAVSESEIFPTTFFDNEDLPDEGARLWKAGYKLGIYKVIENNEVPKEFLETGMLSQQQSD